MTMAAPHRTGAALPFWMPSAVIAPDRIRQPAKEVAERGEGADRFFRVALYREEGATIGRLQAFHHAVGRALTPTATACPAGSDKLLLPDDQPVLPVAGSPETPATPVVFPSSAFTPVSVTGLSTVVRTNSTPNDPERRPMYQTGHRLRRFSARFRLQAELSVRHRGTPLTYIETLGILIPRVSRQERRGGQCRSIPSWSAAPWRCWC